MALPNIEENFVLNGGVRPPKTARGQSHSVKVHGRLAFVMGIGVWQNMGAQAAGDPDEGESYYLLVR